MVTLEGEVRTPERRAASESLFAELHRLVARRVVSLRERGAPVDLSTLDLRDFHVLRAVATRLGWLAEDALVIACRNCAAPISVRPCAALALGPFVDGELDDEELDRTLDLSTPHPIPEIDLPGGGAAREITLRPLTVADAAALHRALRRRHLVLSAGVVRAMGIVALGEERDARKIAAALERCPDDAWAALSDLFLAAHYPPRLAAVAVCPTCAARNDVDAPYDRELEPSRPEAETNDQPFPDLDAFARRSKAAFDACGAAAGSIRLVVEGGVPACDEGGEPLLGAYVPPGGDPTAPIGAGEIVLYYRTFRAMWQEDGPYDWEGEIDETVEHELEHHRGWLVGHDEMDDEERAAIARERRRIEGRSAGAREAVTRLGADLRDFIARTWPVWLIVIAATLAITVCGR